MNRAFARLKTGEERWNVYNQVLDKVESEKKVRTAFAMMAVGPHKIEACSNLLVPPHRRQCV